MNLDKIVEYERFARIVFNHYNGVINQINAPAGLITERCELRSNNLMGYTKNPNVVHINIMPIYRAGEGKEEQVRYYILETIIHELFHCDQIINYRRMGIDAGYRMYIEKSNMVMTAMYILSHMNEIKNTFGVNAFIFEKHNTDCIKRFSGHMYHRRKFDDHIIIILKGLISAEFPKEEYRIRNIINNSNTGSVIFKVNGERLPIKQGRFCNSIDNINTFLYNNIYIYDSLQFNIEINSSDNHVIISIDINGAHEMVIDKEVSDDRCWKFRQVFC